MRKLILMTSAAIIAPLSGLAEDITCTATPNCADLGYTSTTSCDNGVKCPWGEAWFCPPSPPEVCEIGSILYSDMTCSIEVKAGKTPIGVVVYVDSTGVGQALALKSLDTKYTWGGYGNVIPRLHSSSQDYASCENSNIIMATGDKDTYPAVWAANEYSTEGTSVGDWCLPAKGIFHAYGSHSYLLEKQFNLIGGTPFIGGTNGSESRVWSSNEADYDDALRLFLSSSTGLMSDYKNYRYEVRPVFEFVQTFEGLCKGEFKYFCTGERETGGSGEACGGRYRECSCEYGAVWWKGKCVSDNKAAKWGQCTGYAGQHCKIGDILYSDGTCSSNVMSGKTPIAVVVYIDSNDCGQAIALKSIGSYKWSTETVDISGLTNYSSASAASQDVASCENSKIIMAKGDKSTYPAVWAANEYSTEGTSAGDWCLPAAGIFTSYYNNQTAINLGFEKAGWTTFTTSTYAWSSSERSSSNARNSDFKYSLGLSSRDKTNSTEVRPVIEF